ncbi:MAG TPA: GlsB/YeaQ/YmgE family stress response membrane protein [Caldilineaceae bacterium]|nr:GlsB/YeaQ/YmgE family stress response membrane protein [Caldilineaceae bacterium]
MLNFLTWIVLGGIAGWLASMVTGRNDQMGCISNILAGVVGAFVGGWIMAQFGQGGFSGFNLPSLAVAFVGAVVVLAILNLITRR